MANARCLALCSWLIGSLLWFLFLMVAKPAFNNSRSLVMFGARLDSNQPNPGLSQPEPTWAVAKSTRHTWAIGKSCLGWVKLEILVVLLVLVHWDSETLKACPYGKGNARACVCLSPESLPVFWFALWLPILASDLYNDWQHMNA